MSERLTPKPDTAPPDEVIEVAREREAITIGEQVIARITAMLGDVEGLQKEGAFSAAKRLVEKMQTLWPEYTGRPPKTRFRLDALSPALAGTTLHFEMMTEDGEVGVADGQREMVIGLGRLFAAATPEERAAALVRVAEQVHHELTHVAHPGTEAGDGREGAARYLTHPGEVRAHAKQFAYRFVQHYPGAPFDLEKMRSLADGMDKAYQYFVLMADPVKQDEYRAVADLAEAHRVIVTQTAKFVEIFSGQE